MMKKEKKEAFKMVVSPVDGSAPLTIYNPLAAKIFVGKVTKNKVEMLGVFLRKGERLQAGTIIDQYGSKMSTRFHSWSSFLNCEECQKLGHSCSKNNHDRMLDLNCVKDKTADITLIADKENLAGYLNGALSEKEANVVPVTLIGHDGSQHAVLVVKRDLHSLHQDIELVWSYGSGFRLTEQTTIPIPSTMVPVDPEYLEEAEQCMKELEEWGCV